MTETGRGALKVTGVVAVTTVCIAPVLVPRAFDEPFIGPGVGLQVFRFLSLLIPVAAAIACYRVRLDLDRKARVLLILLVSALALLLTEVHFTSVDQARYFPDIGNTEWQLDLQHRVLDLEPQARPHSYRFLADCLVRWQMMFTRSFVFSRTIYRVTTTLLLLYAIYYFARLFVSHRAALLGVAFYCAIFPISIRYYAGQVIDPLSHLSFVLSFIFLRRGRFTEFSSAVLIGALAKETILAMPFYALASGHRDRSRRLRYGGLALAGVALFVTVRSVVGGTVEYEALSGVDPSHLATNLGLWHLWWKQILFTIGIFLPFVIPGWRRNERFLRTLVLFLLPVLLVSSALFSWLHEARNYIPLVVPLAVMAADRLGIGGAEGPLASPE